MLLECPEYTNKLTHPDLGVVVPDLEVKEWFCGGDGRGDSNLSKSVFGSFFGLLSTTFLSVLPREHTSALMNIVSAGAPRHSLCSAVFALVVCPNQLSFCSVAGYPNTYLKP